MMKSTTKHSVSSTDDTVDCISEELISSVQSLIQMNIDSQKGFSEAAESVDHAEIAALFRGLSEERSHLATELQKLVQTKGEEPMTNGSVVGALHRSWLDLRSALSGGDVHAVLSEAERGEDYIKDAYENALDVAVGCEWHAILSQQYAEIKVAHDRIRDLRDAFAE
jgi:uncharacterized protein (TIGR02284 family)